MINKKGICEFRLVLFRTLFVLAFLLILINIVSAIQINPVEYNNEFNNFGEICSINDSFFYTDSLNQLSFISVYECCKEGSCLKLPFDVQNRRELPRLDMEESFNINFARVSIRQGKLKPSNYFPESFDVCSYFSDKLPEQSRGLAVKTADKMVEFEPKNYQRIYKIIKGAGVASGFISEFNIGVFVVGVGCNGLSKQERNAFFKVGECYNNIQSIESGTAHYGISSETYNCMQEADALLKIVINSWGQQIKNTLNKLANGVIGVWNYGSDLIKGNTSTKLTISETNYEAAQRIDSKLNIEKTYLENPSKTILSNLAEHRFSEKKNLAILEYKNLKEQYQVITAKVPSIFFEFFKNLFYKPNIKYNDSRLYLSSADEKLDNMKYSIQICKYNSAHSLNYSIYSDLNLSSFSLESKSKIYQKFDYAVLILFIIILVIAVYFFFKIVF